MLTHATTVGPILRSGPAEPASTSSDTMSAPQGSDLLANPSHEIASQSRVQLGDPRAFRSETAADLDGSVEAAAIEG